MSRTRVFIYGTLKRGQRNHAVLSGQHFIGLAETLPLYRLYDRGPYPCLVDDPDNGISVQGELWAVDEPTLRFMDELEEVPDLYVRREIALQGAQSLAVAYFYNEDVSLLKSSGGSWAEKE